MKKFFAAVIALGLIVSGCSKSENNKERKPSKNIDSSSWVDNLIDGKAAAQKENKKIFLFISSDDDEKSASLKENLFFTEEFLSKITEEYVPVNLDFSSSRFEQAQTGENPELKQIVEENLKDLTLYNVEGSPSFYCLSKEGFFILKLELENDVTLEKLEMALASKSEEFAVYENVLKSTSEGKKEEKLDAIQRLFEITPVEYHHLLSSKAQEFVALDKNNETGNAGTYVMNLANSKAVEAFINQDPKTASDEFAKAAEHKYLLPEQKQQCYYTAGYLLAQSGTDDMEVVVQLLQKAFDAAPESLYAPQIQQMISIMQNTGEEQPFDAQSESN